jgi:hypothetical protein
MSLTALPALSPKIQLPRHPGRRTDPRSQVETFTELSITQQHRVLGAEEARTLREATQAIEEAGTLGEAERTHLARRPPRTAMRLKLSFATPREAALAFSRDAELGQVAMAPPVPLQPGMALSLFLAVPGWRKAAQALGEVVWARDGQVGIAFRELSASDQARVDALVEQHTSFMDRLRTSMGRAPVRIADERLSVAPSILLQTSERLLLETATAVLGLRGYHVSDTLPPGSAPELVLADGHHLADATAQHPGVPVLVLNASGMESLMGKLSRLRPVGFVRRPANACQVADAVEAALCEDGLRQAS